MKCYKRYYHFECVQNMQRSTWRNLNSDDRNTWICSVCDPSTKTQAPRSQKINEPIKEQLNKSFCDPPEHDSTKILAEIANLAQQIAQLQPLLAIPNQLDSLKAEIKGLTTTIEAQRKQLSEATAKITLLESKNAQLSENLERVYYELQDNLQYQRRNNVIITGIPSANDREDEKTTSQAVGKLLSHLNVRIEPWDIVAAHRLPKKRTRDGKPTPEPPPVIVKFHRRTTKREAITSSIAIKPTAEIFGGDLANRIYLNDHLTRENERLLGNARYRLMKSAPEGKRFFSVKFRDDRILAKQSPQSRPIRIQSYADLDRITATVQHPPSSQWSDQTTPHSTA